MPPRPRPVPVVISLHAMDRWREYGRPDGALTPGRVRLRVRGALRGGSRVRAGAVQVTLEGLRVVLVPVETGGWVAVTVLPRREKA